MFPRRGRRRFVRSGLAAGQAVDVENGAAFLQLDRFSICKSRLGREHEKINLLRWDESRGGTMAMFPGYIEYKKREFCNDVRCPIQLSLNGQKEGSEEYERIRGICKNDCIRTTYQFHHWLIEKGFVIGRPR
jgi:hypothetical protein